MQLNAEDGGNRKFICVQLPEECAEDSEAAKAGFKTICEIGKERIRRAGEKIKAEVEKKIAEKEGELKLETGSDADAALAVPDIGFKVFKLDTSNVRAWNPLAEDLEQELINAEDNIVKDRTRRICCTRFC